MKLQITTERLTITPFTLQWLEAYRQNFTPEVTRYQYPDPFPDPGTAQQVLSGFIADMERGDMLELVILGHKGDFLGSAEVFGLREKAPELGIWLKGSAQGQGYGKEVLEGILGYLDGFRRYEYYIYEADERNAPSICLVEKFPHERGRLQRVITESGKELMLRTYHIRARR